MLNIKIIEVCGTQAVFAERMGLPESDISLKLNNKISWERSEIQNAVEILGLSDVDVQSYFFTILN